MVIIQTIMNVLPEKHIEVLQTLLALLKQPEKRSGCLSYGIFRDIENEHVFNLISEWKTRQHLDRHIHSDHFSILLGTKSLLRDPLKIQILTVSAPEGTEAVHSIRRQ